MLLQNTLPLYPSMCYPTYPKCVRFIVTLDVNIYISVERDHLNGIIAVNNYFPPGKYSCGATILVRME